jgi:hypothetical protein
MLTLVITQLALGASATAISVNGQVTVESGGTTTTLVRFAEVPEGATVATGADALAQLRLASGSLVRLGPSTRVALATLEQRQPRGNRKEGVKLFAGRLWLTVTKLFGAESRFTVETENAVAGVRGTGFFVESAGGKDRFMLEHGKLEVNRGDKLITLDQVGAFVDATVDGLGDAGFLDRAAVETASATVGGKGATLVSKLRSTRTARGLISTFRTPSSERRRLRQDILRPEDVADASIAVAPDVLSGAPGGAIDADVIVRVRVP